MGVTVTTDHACIGELLDRLLAADPVRNTVLGTVRADLSETAWCAWTADGAGVAARCAAEYPVVTAGRWDRNALDVLALPLADLSALAGVSGTTDVVEHLDTAIRRHEPRPVAHRMRQRLFRLDSLSRPHVPGSARRAGPTDRAHPVGDYAEIRYS